MHEIVKVQLRRPVTSRAMIVFMISDVPPKIDWTRPSSSSRACGCGWVHRACFTGGYDQEVAGAIDERPARSGACPRPVIALSIATATWLAIAPMRYRSAAA